MISKPQVKAFSAFLGTLHCCPFGKFVGAGMCLHICIRVYTRELVDMCLCGCVCVYMWIHVHMCACVCRSRRSTSVLFLKPHSPDFGRQVFITDDKAAWLGSSRDPSVPRSQLVLQAYANMPGFLNTGTRDQSQALMFSQQRFIYGAPLQPPAGPFKMNVRQCWLSEWEIEKINTVRTEAE